MEAKNLKFELTAKTFDVFHTRDLFLYLMLGICEDFDDDLLFDAVDLLTNW
jgi:hypothetical protein